MEFAPHWLTLPGGHQLHHIDEGSGPPVLMVHGNPTWSFYYRRLVEHLSPRYRCVVPDHIGCGLSDKPRDEDYDYHFAQRADDLDSLIDALQLKDITLVVHDWGGMIGFLSATRRPELFRRFVVLNTGAFPLPAAKRFPLTLSIGRNTSLGSFFIRGLNLFSFCTSYFGCHRRRMSEVTRQGYLAPYDNWDHRRAVLRFVQDIPLKKGDRGYETICAVEQGLAAFRDHPVQIFWGLKDFVFDAHFLSRWQSLLPAAEVHAFEDCGHYILEDAFEEIAPLLDTFLARTEAEEVTR